MSDAFDRGIWEWDARHRGWEPMERTVHLPPDEAVRLLRSREKFQMDDDVWWVIDSVRYGDEHPLAECKAVEVGSPA